MALNLGKIKESALRVAFSYIRPLPLNFVEEDSNRFDSIRTCNVSHASIIEICEAKVVQYYIFLGSRMLEEFCIPVQLTGKQRVYKQFVKLYLFPRRRLTEAIWVIDLWSKNYFHWILECFPRILALRQKGINSPLLIPEHLYKMSYINESLSYLGIEVITYNFRESIIIEKLHTVTHDSPCAFDLSYLHNLKDFFLSLDGPVSMDISRRIYVSRVGASKRRILNEAELIPYLEARGFEVFQMEKLTFKEQRLLMRESKVLLSSHGAGFTNMIYMPSNSTIIELHPETERYNSCFYHLASALNFKYLYSFEESSDPNPQNADLTINIPHLLDLLDSDLLSN